jgi:hypothetical protein
MNFQIYSSLIGLVLIAAAAANILPQQVQADGWCIDNPKDCIYVPIEWLKLRDNIVNPPPNPPPCETCLTNILDLERILTIPENQSFRISVQHDNVKDTVIIEIPKALTSLQQNNSTIK